MMHGPLSVETCATRTEWAAALNCAIGRAVLHGRKQQVWFLHTSRIWVIQDAL